MKAEREREREISPGTETRDVRHQQFGWQISGEPWPRRGVQTGLTAELLPRMHGFSHSSRMLMLLFCWKTTAAAVAAHRGCQIQSLCCQCWFEGLHAPLQVEAVLQPLRLPGLTSDVLIAATETRVNPFRLGWRSLTHCKKNNLGFCSCIF